MLCRADQWALPVFDCINVPSRYAPSMSDETEPVPPRPFKLAADVLQFQNLTVVFITQAWLDRMSEPIRAISVHFSDKDSRKIELHFAVTALDNELREDIDEIRFYTETAFGPGELPNISAAIHVNEPLPTHCSDPYVRMVYLAKRA